MADLNVVTLAGRLVADPELRSTPNSSVVTFRIANETGFGDYKQTNFIDVTAWGKQAESVCQYFTKGKPIQVVGELNQQTWEDKTSGERRSKLEVKLSNFHFPPSYPKDEKETGPEEPTKKFTPKAETKKGAPKKNTPKAPVTEGGDDEDIPF